jgi:DNA polymerase-3 subunit alpha
MAEIKYYPPHVHLASGSVGDSILKMEDYISQAKEFGLDSLFVTEHGTLRNMYEFIRQCKAAGIKPIVGCEVYLVDDRLSKNPYEHLVLIANNTQGLTNLIDIVSDANTNGFYKKPRTDLDYINGMVNDTVARANGITALSACISGPVSRMILRGASDTELMELIAKMKRIFDDFYLEIMPGDFEEQATVNAKLIELAYTTNTKLIASNDVHYLSSDDVMAHNYHVCLERKSYENVNQLVYPDTCYYFMDTKDMRNRLMKMTDANTADLAILTTGVLADSVEEYNLNTEIRFPEYPVEGYEHIDILRYLCYQKLKKIKDLISDIVEYESRLEYELEAINELGYSSYFLVVKDYIDNAVSNGIEIGPGRGSINGSLVAYLMDITKIDPIRYGLMFERFLSKYRKGSVPDVDTDCSAKRRGEVFAYITRKYGINNCALVSTSGTRKAKAAIRDLGRVLGIDLAIVDAIAKLIPTVWYDNGEKQTDLSIEDSVAVVPELQRYKENYPELFHYAEKLEGLPKNTSTHAAGTIIAPIALNDIVPLTRSSSSIDLYATELELKSAEAAGLIKYDILGLSTLDVVRSIKDRTKDVFDYEFGDFDDPEIWDAIGSKNTAGMFQISSATYKQRMWRLKPRSIPALANCLALLRSPCIMARQDEVYMEILEGKREVELLHPFYDDATSDTLGILLYQEQLMQIMVNCGFDLETSFTIMKLISKKKVSQLEVYKEQYYSNVLGAGMDVDTADRIWHTIEQAGLYLFNKGHGTAYAVLCYCTAYYRVKHPDEFLASCLTDAFDNDKDIAGLIRECKRIKTKILLPDANESEWQCSPQSGKIILGGVAVKGLGENAFGQFTEHRPFESVEDAYVKVNKQACNKRAFSAAIFGGMFDWIGGSRADIYRAYMTEKKDKLGDEVITISRNKLSINAPNKDFEKLIYGVKL